MRSNYLVEDVLPLEFLELRHRLLEKKSSLICSGGHCGCARVKKKKVLGIPH